MKMQAPYFYVPVLCSKIQKIFFPDKETSRVSINIMEWRLMQGQPKNALRIVTVCILQRSEFISTVPHNIGGPKLKGRTGCFLPRLHKIKLI